MDYYFTCFNRIIFVHLYKKASDMLLFWLKRFCPNVEIIKNQEPEFSNYDLSIELIKSENYDYVINDNYLKIYGKMTDNESYIAKFITQCFQKLLINDDILIVPAACVSNNNSAILIIGDFWQGKTSVAINMTKKYDLNLISDNYVAIKNSYIIGATNYISVREEDVKDVSFSLYNVNNRYFFENGNKKNIRIKIVNFLLPYINNGDDNVHKISKEESRWYLYQKFIRLLSGETILFDGKLPSPAFLDKNTCIKILKIVDNLLDICNIEYVSSNIDTIISCGLNLLYEGDSNE